jgi:hypothetical protein
MTWTPWHELRVRVAAGFAIGATAIAIYAAAWALAEPRVEASPSLSFSVPAATRTLPARPPIAQLAALAPFGVLESAATPAASAALVPAITLVGTLAGADSPAAICRLGTGTARILHVGDTLGGWRLQQVTPGRAVFVDGALARHELRLSPVGK